MTIACSPSRVGFVTSSLSVVWSSGTRGSICSCEHGLALSSPRRRLRVAGSGPDEAAARRYAKELGIAHRVEFMGWVDGADKWTLLSDGRLVVVPSRREVCGIVALEALAAGTPVLAFDIPCIREVLPAECTWRVTPFDVDSLAEALADVCGRRPDARHRCTVSGLRPALRLGCAGCSAV